ncbi:hypothetical protein AAY473_028009 [Plecturocebus cupreus]
MGFHHTGQAGLKLLASKDPPASAAPNHYLKELKIENSRHTALNVEPSSTQHLQRRNTQSQRGCRHRSQISAANHLTLVTQAGVQWRNHGSLHQPPRLNQSSHLRLLKIRFCHVAHADRKLLGSSNLPTSPSQRAEIARMSHYA